MVSADSMHCQTETAKAIVSTDTDYFLTVKGNQLALLEALNATLLNAIDREDHKLCDRAIRIREHSGVANKQHWIPNVAFSKDSSRIRKGSSPEISPVFCRLAFQENYNGEFCNGTLPSKITFGVNISKAYDNPLLERPIASFPKFKVRMPCLTP